MSTAAPSIEYASVPVEELVPYPGNARRGNVELIASSLATHGQYRPLTVQASTMRVLAGNHTLKAALSLGWTKLDAGLIDVDDETAARINIIDNRANDLAEYDTADLLAQLQGLPDLTGTGYEPVDLDRLIADLTPPDPKPRDLPPSLRERYGYPPFSVLDARSGEWQDRKREWLSIGLQSEVGRGSSLSFNVTPNPKGKGIAPEAEPGPLLWKSVSAQDPQFYAKKRAVEAEIGRELTLHEFMEGGYYVPLDPEGWASGTSVFDPVLCELVYRWWGVDGGTVIDPFAGGSVRGVLAAAAGLAYTGIELREEQVAANREQWATLGPVFPGEPPTPSWIVGDSTVELAKLPAGGFDMAFSCPPYFNLEKYSDDPADISTLNDYATFAAAYSRIIAATVARLRPGGYLVLAVSEVRDSRRGGRYVGLVPTTIQAAVDAGCSYECELVLLNQIGSAAVRISNTFEKNRRPARLHQTVVVFRRDAEETDPKARRKK